MTIHHLRPAKSVNTAFWLEEACEAAANANGVVILAFYSDEKSQDLCMSYCNLNEQELTWVAAKLQDFVADQRRRDDE